ncbi:hypothetical protein [Pseudoalteromonas sp. S1612]|uniref:hypothetical protein n=1 Tax=Pseudoalteromonas sp. S1612 TaxID=579507 RepID=UPI00110AA06A|nr:hypothetical protein [Pseudoalteromonas sp. S1612]TMP55551.1 hypothetical protein CWB78_08020 [Pseudoalteromonas sp. S1612]
MQYLSTIFESTADQARLVTVIFSTLIAIFVVFLNHYLQKRRERKELLRDKISKLYKLSNEYRSTGIEWTNSLMNGLANGVKPTATLVNNVHSTVSNITMIKELYFQNEKMNFKSFDPVSLPIYKNINEESREKSNDLLNDNSLYLQKECRRLIKKHL